MIAGVVVIVAVVVIVGVLAAILLAGQTKGVNFVVPCSLDISVTRSLIEGAVHDRWPIDYRAAARKVPEDLSGCRIQCVHLS